MPPVLQHLLICDDVRQEIGNKMTLVGIYGRSVILPPNLKFPAHLPKLSFFSRWKGLHGGERVTFKFEFEGKEFGKFLLPTPITAPEHPDDYSHHFLGVVGFELRGYGRYRVKIYLNDSKSPSYEEDFFVVPGPPVQKNAE